MFSDCSGPCHTCVASGGCLAGHGDDHYVVIGMEEAQRRIEARKTTGGKHYTKQELNDIAAIAGMPAPDPISMQVMVEVKDLKVLARMGCEHVTAGGESCDSADLVRGGCCNACWASRWARRVLSGSGHDY